MNILVLLGTAQLPFEAILRDVESFLEESNDRYNVTAQIGHTHFRSELMDCIPFISFTELDKMYDSADLIITHAGVGSIMQGLKKNKKIIARARRYRNGESVDDNQIEILESFSNRNYLIEWDAKEPLSSVIEEVKEFKSDFNSNLENPIDKYLTNLINK